MTTGSAYPSTLTRTVVFTALAVSHYIYAPNCWVTKTFVRSARHYRAVQTGADRQLLTAINPLRDDPNDAITKVNDSPS